MRPIDAESWALARRIVAKASNSSLYCGIASINPDGTPHVTPIGSLMLLDEPGRAIYFDVFNARLGHNVDRNPDVCILAVDSRKLTWLRALLRGRFDTPPGVQLRATVGGRRPATQDEIDRFERAVGPFLRTKGGRIAWSGLADVRDVTIESMATVRLGAMTRAERDPVAV